MLGGDEESGHLYLAMMTLSPILNTMYDTFGNAQFYKYQLYMPRSYIVVKMESTTGGYKEQYKTVRLSLDLY